MINISSALLQTKIEAFAKSPEGQKRMKATVDRYKKEGKSTTAAGSPLVATTTMIEAAAKMIAALRSAAQDAGLPESVQAHFNSLAHTTPQLIGKDKYVVYIYFNDDLSRKSLDNDLGYEGIDNIIALFNNGAHAENYVYGWWEGHAPTSADVKYRSGVDSPDAWVRSKKDREGLQFMQQAVADFNGSYGSTYGVTASVGSSYT